MPRIVCEILIAPIALLIAPIALRNNDRLLPDCEELIGTSTATALYKTSDLENPKPFRMGTGSRK